MGRAPCCDKANVKKGPWAPEEDATLKAYIEEHGTGGNWIALPQKIGLKRCGKSCRLRWLNYLRPDIKHGGFSEEEDRLICSLYVSIGSRWSIIASQLPGRTDNDIKNYWNTRLKKKLLGKQQRKEDQALLYHRRRKGDHHLLTKMRSPSHYDIPSSIVVGRGKEENISSQLDPYLQPELLMQPPVPYLNHEHPRCCFINHDHTSIRKLLIKLGGKFTSDEEDHINVNHQPVNMVSHYFPVDNTTLQAASSSSSQNSQIVNMLPIQEAAGQSTFPTVFDHDIMCNYTTNPQKPDGLEFFYGGDILCEINTSSAGITSCGDSSMDWGGDMIELAN